MEQANRLTPRRRHATSLRRRRTAAAVRDCLQLLPSSFTLQKKPYLYRRCFPHSPEIILHFIPMRVHNRVLSKNHHQAF